jgi:diketogulonate reductase-like aldo/keto reductase
MGAMTFGTEWGWGADEATAPQLFNTYVDAGGNFIDTADLYTGGTNETWLGKFVAERNTPCPIRHFCRQSRVVDSKIFLIQFGAAIAKRLVSRSIRDFYSKYWFLGTAIALFVVF